MCSVKNIGSDVFPIKIIARGDVLYSIYQNYLRGSTYCYIVYNNATVWIKQGVGCYSHLSLMLPIQVGLITKVQSANK